MTGVKGRGSRFTQADFLVGAGKATTFPRSTPALCHSHPHWQRTESHNLGFLRSALQIAHDLIHIVFTHRYCADLSKTVSFLVVAAYSATSSLSRPITKEARSLKCYVFCSSSVCIEQIRVGMAPRCGGTVRLNGTAVLDGITFRPFSANFNGCNFGGAGGWALNER